jgi:hypothetical protein
MYIKCPAHVWHLGDIHVRSLTTLNMNTEMGEKHVGRRSIERRETRIISSLNTNNSVHFLFWELLRRPGGKEGFPF